MLCCAEKPAGGSQFDYICGMEKKHFLYKLIAPRPDFHLTMSPEEQAAMGSHVQYWQELIHGGQALLFGPVFDPSGVYGMAVLETTEETGAAAIADQDPAVQAGICTYALFSMQLGGSRL